MQPSVHFPVIVNQIWNQILCFTAFSQSKGSLHFAVLMTDMRTKLNTVEPRYLKLAYFESALITKWKSGPCFNMKLLQQVTK